MIYSRKSGQILAKWIVENSKCTGKAEIDPFEKKDNYHFFRDCGCTKSSNRLNRAYYKVCKACYQFVKNPANKIKGRYAFMEKNGKRGITKRR